MQPSGNAMTWTERDEEEQEDAVSWTKNSNNHRADSKDNSNMNPSLSTFKSILETGWYTNPSHFQTLSNPHQDFKDTNITFCSNPAFQPENLMLQPMDSSSSCSPSQAFNFDPLSQPCFSSLNAISNSPFDGGFDLGGCDPSFLANLSSNSPVFMGLNPQIEMGNNSQLSQNSELTHLLPMPNNNAVISGGFGPNDFEGFGDALFLNRSSSNKVLRPLEVSPPVGAQPTLFQKRAALRQSSNELGNLGISELRSDGIWGKRESVVGELSKKRKRKEEEEFEEGSIDGSGLDLDSDEFLENDYKGDENGGDNGGNNSNANSSVTGGDQKGKKKGLPAKNLMAERRRRKKLNDRASILGDAIEYLKELLQRINDLHNELEATPPGSLLQPATSFHPLTPTLPYRVKDELGPSSLPSPKNQPARVEVRLREGRTVNIHMFCGSRPGLLLSTMRALDNLGLDIQQAVISCFNGFALDVFKAEVDDLVYCVLSAMQGRPRTPTRANQSSTSGFSWFPDLALLLHFAKSQGRRDVIVRSGTGFNLVGKQPHSKIDPNAITHHSLADSEWVHGRAVQFEMNKQMSEPSTTGIQTEVCDLCINHDMLFSNWEASDFPPSRVRYTKFKEELIAIMALGEERSIEFSVASNGDVNVEDEAGRLKKEMDITIEEVEESKFYNELADQLGNDMIIQSNIRRVLGPNSCLQMVIYGLGSMEYSYISQYQLALVILLKRDFSHWIGGVEVFDPMMSPADCKVVEMFGCSVLAINEQCKRQVEKPTLFFLPYLDNDLVGNLLEANFCPARLNKMVVLSNSLEEMAGGCRNFSKKFVSNGKIYYNRLRERLEYVEAIKKHMTEVKIDRGYSRVVDGFSWHFFHLDLDLNLENLLPEKYVMEPFQNTDPSVYCWTEMDFTYRNTRRMHCFWRPPHAGWVKLNFSGKCASDGGNAPAGFGGIFRDEHGSCLAMYSGSIGGADTVAANAEALRQGLRCMQYLSSPVRKLIAEGDDVRVIRWMNGGPEPPTRVAEALSEIFELLVGIEPVIRHVYEEANSMAIELAKRGTGLPNLRVWVSPSLEDLFA
ncbi:hypothetical protein RHGRI_022700 [Rhododendron griersonianum]|uniref:BHLH domain-containing protein n=1 Tax=Rhododendron griersonianum TaxID=479676 RepID=A0AAV6J0G2_9ERIC|nr:hypothetical protein RHGRI_022700 [Rhododendron griersonianum]